jgi:hypothetical protein
MSLPPGAAPVVAGWDRRGALTLFLLTPIN